TRWSAKPAQAPSSCSYPASSASTSTSTAAATGRPARPARRTRSAPRADTGPDSRRTPANAPSRTDPPGAPAGLHTLQGHAPVAALPAHEKGERPLGPLVSTNGEHHENPTADRRRADGSVHDRPRFRLR